MFLLKYLGCIAILGMFLPIFWTGSETVQDPGEDLARKHCSTCHDFPSPKLLTQKSWNYLLTDMGFRLGIIDYSYMNGSPPLALFSMSARQEILSTGGLIPEQPLVTHEEWETIRSYFINSAPQETLAQPPKPTLKHELPHFQVQFPPYQPLGAVLTMTRINQKGGITVANQAESTLTQIDHQLQGLESLPELPLVVDQIIRGDSILLLSIGDLMGQHVGSGKGNVKMLCKSQSRTITLLSGLLRPADMELADLGGDGKQELIICNFGDVTGDVSIYVNKDGKFVHVKTLIQAPGALKSQVYDFDKDGLLDICVLLGDARENISILYNQGNFNFQRKIVVEAPASYGHTYFELQDFNKDGHMDLLVTNGDTDADPYNTLKNYHGTRIYINDGSHNFHEEYFYPMYGAHFAKACDFDQDGDLDIAVSAFFPDFSSKQPEQFTYLQNRGNLEFAAYTHKATFKGRWMTMDIGDYDLDGDKDIVLGAGYLPLGMAIEHREKLKVLRKQGKAVLVLENSINP